MVMFKGALRTASALKTFDITHSTTQNVLQVHGSSKDWGAISHQEDENHICDPCHKGQSSDHAQKGSDVGRLDCHWLMKILKMCSNYVYAVRFYVDAGTDTLHQQNPKFVSNNGPTHQSFSTFSTYTASGFMAFFYHASRHSMMWLCHNDISITSFVI